MWTNKMAAERRAYSGLAAIWCCLFAALTACGELAATNPYDPETPEAQQARGTLRASFVPPAGFTVRGVARAAVLRQDEASEAHAVELRREDAAEGALRLRLEVPELAAGPYLLSVEVEGLAAPPVRPFVMRQGEDLDLGEFALLAPTDSADFGQVTGIVLRQGAPEGGHGGTAIRTDGAPWAAVTDDAGAFRLAAPAGTFRLIFAARGYGPAAIDDVVVRARETAALPDAVVLVASPGTLSGVVLLPPGDDTPERYAAVTLALTPAGTASAEPLLLVPATPAGDFVLSPVAPGAWQVTATLDGYQSARERVELAPGQTAEVGPLVLVRDVNAARVSGRAVLAGAPTGAHGGTLVEALETSDAAVTNGDGDFTLATLPGPQTLRFSHPGYLASTAPTPALVSGRTVPLDGEVQLSARPAVVEGAVELPEGFEPVTRLARVRVSATPGPATPALPVDPAIPTADGRFVFPALPAGDWILSADLPGFESARVSVSVAPAAQVALGLLRLEYTVSSPPAVGASGAVRLSDVSGEVGHAGVRVAALGTPLETTTDDTGAFVLGLPPEPLTLVFSRDGYTPVERAIEAPVRVEALADLVVLSARPGRLRGLVALPAAYSDPVRLARVEVTAVRAAGDGGAAVDLPVQHPAADGGFLFDDIPPGRWQVRAVMPEWGLSAVDVVHLAPGGLAETDVLELPSPDVGPGGQVRPPTRLEGTVHRADALDPLGHGGISVEALRTPHATLSTSEGRFVLDVPPEALTLRFSAPGYGTVTLDVPRPVPELTTSLDGEVTLTGRPGAAEGSVTLTRFGTPGALVEVTLRLLDAGGRLTAQAQPGDDGRFILSDLSPGAYVLAASHFGYLTESRAVVVAHGETTALGDVALRHASDTPAAVPFAGSVRFDADESLAGTVVRLRFADRDVALAQAVTGPDGQFEAPAAADDRYTLSAERAGFETLGPVGPYHLADGVFVDDEGRPPELTLVPGRLDGRVDVTFDLEPGWLPPLEQVADVTLAGARATWPRPGVSGRPGVTFDGLAAGVYTVTVSKPGFDGFEGAATLRAGAQSAVFNGTVRLVSLTAARLHLRDVHLTGANLAGIELAGADLGGVAITGSLAGRDLTGTNLSNATLASVDLTGAILDGARLFGADLSGATLTDAHLLGAQLAGADLTGADLQGADLTAANLSGATLENARFAPDAGPTADPPCAPEGERPAVTLTGAIFSGANLRGAHLRGVYLPGGDFSGALLVNATLSAACLTRASFTLTDLSGAHLEGADARGAVFSNAVLSDAHVEGADLHGGRLAGAVLDGAHLGCRDSTLAGTCTCPEAPPRGPGDPATDIAGAASRSAGAACRTDLSAAILDGAALVDADFGGVSMPGASFLGSVLSGTRMADADLAGARFAGVNLGDTSFRRANLSDARMAGVQLTPETDLSGATLSRADLSAATAAGADLRGLAMEGVDLSFATLTEADLRGASLVGARLVGTDVTGAYLSGADLSAVRLFNTHLDTTADLAPPPGHTYGPPLHLPGADLSGRWDIGFISLHPGSDLDGVFVGDGAAMTLEPAGLIGVSLRGATFQGDAVSGVPVRTRDAGSIRWRNVDFSGASLELDLGAAWELDRVVGRDATLSIRRAAIYARTVTQGEEFGWSCGLHDVNGPDPASGPAGLDAAFRITGSDLAGMNWHGPAKGLYVRLSNLDNAHFFEDAPDGQVGVFVSGWDVAESSAVGLSLQNVTEFVDASFRRTALRGFIAPAHLTNVRFFQDDLRDADLVARTATGTTIRTSDLRGARLDQARLEQSCLDKTQNAGMSLRGASLVGTTLRQLDLRGIDLTGARMQADEQTGGMACETFPADLLGTFFSPPNFAQFGFSQGLSGSPPWCGSMEYEGAPNPRNFRAAGPTSCYEGVGWPGVQCWSASGNGREVDRYTLTNATRFAVANSNLLRELFWGGRGINASEVVLHVSPLTPAIDGLKGCNCNPNPTADEAQWASTMAGARVDAGRIQGRDQQFASAVPLTHWSLRGAVFGQSTWPADADYRDVDFSEMVPGQATGPGPGGHLTFRRARFTPSASPLLGFNQSIVDADDVLADGATLAGTVLAGSTFSDTSLVGASFAGTSLANARLIRTVLRGADLSRGNLIGAQLQGTDLSGANLSGVSVAEIDWGTFPVGREDNDGPVNLKGADLSGAQLDAADLTQVLVDADTRFARADLASVRLPTDLRGMNLDGVSLTRLNWTGNDLRGLSMAGATIVEAVWNDVVLVDADLHGTTLNSLHAHRLQLQRANLRGARFTNGQLLETRFDHADLQDAFLADSDLTDSNFTGADLRGAELPPSERIGADTHFDGAHLCASALDPLTPAQASVVIVDPGC